MNLQVFFEGQPQVLEWGVVRLDKPLPNAGRLEAWVGQGMHAGLRYMEERLEERLSPPKLFPWAKSAVIFSIRQPVPFGADTGAFRLASYALGEDYHHIARRILNAAEMHVRTVGATHGSPLPFVHAFPPHSKFVAQYDDSLRLMHRTPNERHRYQLRMEPAGEWKK